MIARAPFVSGARVPASGVDPAAGVSPPVLAAASAGTAEVAITEGAAALRRLADRYPANPFATFGYATARATAGTRAVVIEMTAAGVGESCLGLLSGGQRIRSLEIPSLAVPPGDVAAPLREVMRAMAVGLVNVFPYQSRTERIPAWFPVEWRRTTHEYLWRLDADPTPRALAKSARQGVRQARAAGCVFRAAPDTGLLPSHEVMLAESRDRRRARGERLGVAPPTDRMGAFLDHGVGEIHQVLGPDGRVHSSAMVLRSPQGAYLHSMGGSDDGFVMGAGKLLVFEGARHLFAGGVRDFNLGSGSTEGLRTFKALFGAQPRPVEAGILASMGRWERRVRGAADRVLGNARSR